MATALRSVIRGRDAAETKDRLLDAAELLFAERGFNGTSMRAVTQAAGVSVSAANYHFGTKEALFEATYWRTIRPVNEVRLARLAALEAEEGPLSVADVLDAFLRPAIETPDGASLRGLIARTFSDPPEIVSVIKREYFTEISERFVGALGRALPGRDPEELKLTFQFLVGMMVHVIAGQVETHPVPPNHELTEPEELLARMIRFAAAGLDA